MNTRINTMVNKAIGQAYAVGLTGIVHRAKQGDYIVPLATSEGVYVLIDHTMKLEDCNGDYEIYAELGKSLYNDINCGGLSTYEH